MMLLGIVMECHTLDLDQWVTLALLDAALASES